MCLATEHFSTCHFHVDQFHWLFTLSIQRCRLSNRPFRFLIDHVTTYGYNLFVSYKHHSLAYMNSSYSLTGSSCNSQSSGQVIRYSRAILPERVQIPPVLERGVKDFHNGAARLKSPMAFPTFSQHSRVNCKTHKRKS